MSEQPNITYPQLITLYEVSRKINSKLNLSELLDETMDLAIGLLHAEKGVLLLRDETTGELEMKVARAMDKSRIADAVALVSKTVVRKVESGGEPFLMQNVPDSPGLDPNMSLIRRKIKSVICVPLRSRDKLVGCIYLDTTDKQHFFKTEDLAFLEGFANLAGVAVENARNYRQVEEVNRNLESLVDERTREVQTKHAELQTAYDQLKDTKMQLLRSEKMASLGMLVAGIAHEINTPLSAINSNTDMFSRCCGKLRDSIAEPDLEQHPAAKVIEVLETLSKVNVTAVERITTIVKTLRNFARLDEEDYKQVDLHEGLDSTLTLTAHLSRDRIECVKKYGKIPRLTCYASQLNQVFMNILVNSCQAISGAGVITIATSHKDDQIVIAISDTGSGIASENLDRIFDPGFTTKGVGVGTGLGLSISYRIVEEHGGKIVVESRVGKGTTFTIHLPVKYPPPLPLLDAEVGNEG